MTHNERQKQLAALGWHPECDPWAGVQIQHNIDGRVWCLSGTIAGVQHDIWLRERDGFVFLQIDGPDAGRDFTFDAFCDLVRDGWPKPKVAPAVRGFDFGDE